MEAEQESSAAPVPLTQAQRSRLRGLAQRLEPVAHLGRQGLTPAFLASVDTALAEHELVKVRLHAFKEERKKVAADLASRTGSELLTVLGHVVVLFRRQADPAKRKVRF